MRLAAGGAAIDRGQPLAFTFDGKPFVGFAGDTIASALLGAGVRVVGRSFKYHRPRGVWGHGVEDPNAIFDLRIGGSFEPNARGATSLLREGLAARSVNAKPDAATDANSFLDLCAPFIPAGFYYKTFMWPDWRRFEPRIRAMAGLGSIDAGWAPQGFSAQVNLACDVLVVGAGAAGLSAALAAARQGRDVCIVDEGSAPGGALLYREALVEGEAPSAWLAAALAELQRLGVRRLARATAYGVYDHDLVCVCEQLAEGAAPRLWRVRPKEIVLASGAIERPLVFANNDRPGVMSAASALHYLRRYGVRVGERVGIVSNNDSTREVAAAFREAGAAVVELDAVQDVKGRTQVEAVVDGAGRRHAVDALLVSGGFTPSVHLYAQAKGKLIWSEAQGAFLPGPPVGALRVVGAAAGDLGCSVRAQWPGKPAAKRAWIDFQSDVTLKDVALAARENFRSVEHLKRYTTLGMATDQGKTSNLNGLAAMAAITGRTIAETGTTTYRPPYAPVSMMAFTGRRHGEFFNPLRRLALEPQHRAAGALFGEYGGWLRPAAYGRDIQEEALRAREAVGIFDASPLGKIEVVGPDAAAFLDFNCYGRMSTLKPGRLRYGFMLQETGVVFDDGVIARLDDDRFVVSCSSAHVVGVHLRFEEWRQDRFDAARVHIHNATPRWATLAATGPKARRLLEAIGFGASVAMLPHMAFATTEFDGAPARIARVSFSGDLSFEISVPQSKATRLLAALREAGVPLGVSLLGLEALMILRAEKGYIVIGKDTDGTTMPHDLGLAAKDKRSDEFIGRRSLFTEVAEQADRRQFVGFEVAPGETPLPTGAHGVETAAGKPRSIGYVTSSYFSPTLGRPIALGLIERGAQRHGETIRIQHLGRLREARLAPPCALDLAGDRLRV